MGKFRSSERGDQVRTEQPDIRVSVTNFGPVRNGHVDLRPLSVFVGPSNTGKTYLAILVYALRRILGGFPRLPIMYSYQNRFFGQDTDLDLSVTTADALVEEVQGTLRRLEVEGGSFTYSGLPKSAREIAQSFLNDPNSLGSILSSQLQRCFDLNSVAELVRFSGQDNMEVSLFASERKRSLWRLQLEVTTEETATKGLIEDMDLFPNRRPESVSNFRQGLSGFSDLVKMRQGQEPVWNSQFLLEHFEELLEVATLHRYSDTHYLPAARSGIIQSHRVIASSLVERSTRGGLEHFPELPTFSGVMADFLQKLILFEEAQGNQNSVVEAAEALEREALAGQIRATRSQVGGYPEFAYRPSGMGEDIRLTRASSMVSELAPVVLFLRGAVSPGDMLIIEEPEAHLHPAAQTQMARTLASLVRAGVRVVVTTHSDWLLMEIANLMREGELQEISGKQVSDKGGSSALLPSEVGVWLFREDDDYSGSTIEEIPFNRSEGIEPEEYESVAEALYNRSAALQNQFQELAGAAAREQE